jgi:hypothetical protein
VYKSIVSFSRQVCVFWRVRGYVLIDFVHFVLQGTKQGVNGYFTTSGHEHT